MVSNYGCSVAFLDIIIAVNVETDINQSVILICGFLEKRRQYISSRYTKSRIMNYRISRMIKHTISILATLNIIALLLFEYGLSMPSVLAPESSVEEQSIHDNEVGTIEEVKQETAAKEAKAAETILARDNTQDQEETEEDDDVETQRDSDSPALELTTDHIFLHVGDRFNYMSYIKTMEDVDGSDLSHYIHLDKYVDTSVPGEIELTYRITSPISGKSTSKVLLITIQE